MREASLESKQKQASPPWAAGAAHEASRQGATWAEPAGDSRALGPRHSPLISLQRAMGNQAVGRMLQAKLTVSEPGDIYEQEADRLADQVMRMPAPALSGSLSSHAGHGLQRACACGGESAGECAECKDKREGGVQRAAEGAATTRYAPPVVHEALRSHGHPLDHLTRSFMETRFGHDFGGVRVHTDAKAAESARAVNALAYTVGQHTVFAPGRYEPTSFSGRTLLAHELAHVVQQTGDLAPVVARQQEDTPDGGPSDAGLPGGVSTPPDPETSTEPAPERKCGPDITSSLGTMLSSVGPYFKGLSSWQKRRSCMALDIDAPLALVNPIMAWDTRQLFLPNTGFLDRYFRSSGCGSPRDPGCETDGTRNLCETAGSCGNTVVVGGKCMLAGTANYALYGKMFKLCNDEFSPDYPRWDMRAMIWLYKVIPDDPGPPLAMATAAFDGAFPTVPAAAENRGSCTGRCGVVHGQSFDFIWEPYQSR